MFHLIFARIQLATFLEPLLENHDRKQFDITAYAQRVGTDALTIRYRQIVDRWVPTASLSDSELSDRIRADGIDILIDLAGHTAGNRPKVFAKRPAPVSVTWMGYGYTTGLKAIDYFLTDEIMAPKGSEKLFSEKLWRLPSSFVAYRPRQGMGEPGPLPALKNGSVTFGTLTRGIRINYRVIRTWAEILKKLPGSRIAIDSKSFAAEPAQKRLADRFAEHGIERERLIIGYHSPAMGRNAQLSTSDLTAFPITLARR
ncbi:MAG: hypothetical protein MZV65_40970 [Chromatiales bacterium]|nr:hypothetical protein [Chromatiales bacterium]